MVLKDSVILVKVRVALKQGKQMHGPGGDVPDHYFENEKKIEAIFER